ncbi:MAG: DUF504 domain-containing protein [Candidatus Woesearchaeota archaeon]
MIYIGDLLNKIRWDPKENPKDYTIIYFDRMLEKRIEISFASIARVGTFMVIKQDNKDVHIPLHRIREVRKKGKIIWER